MRVYNYSMTPIITYIINASIERSNVPTLLKQTHIRPLFQKNGQDENVLGNFGPVSNLTFLSKVLEKIISNR